MYLEFIKPLLSSLVLPPTLLFLLIFLGLAMVCAKRLVTGLLLSASAVLALWLLSCNAVAVLLADALLQHYPAVSAQSLVSQKIEAIVVLGGGVDTEVAEYGQPQPNSASLARLHYAFWLGQHTGIPVAFTSGRGGLPRADEPPEGEVVLQWVQRTGEAVYAPVSDTPAIKTSLAQLRWIENGSRNTAENATEVGHILRKAGVKRIALVTHAWHMRRSLLAFEDKGFVVSPAPMGFTVTVGSGLFEWMPSLIGLDQSRRVLREALAIAMHSY